MAFESCKSRPGFFIQLLYDCRSDANDSVRQRPDAFDLNLNDVSVTQKDGRISAVADSGRRAGENQVARLERNSLADMRNNPGNGKDEVLRV